MENYLKTKPHTHSKMALKTVNRLIYARFEDNAKTYVAHILETRKLNTYTSTFIFALDSVSYEDAIKRGMSN